MVHARFSVQTTLPADYASNKEFIRELHTLQECRYHGLELNIADPFAESLDAIVDFISCYQLKFTKFASGLTAKTRGLSLSAETKEIRVRSVQELGEIIRYFADSSIGIILGFFKGPQREDRRNALKQFRRSLDELLPIAESQKVTLLVEATNRYESAVANSLKDTVDLIKDYGSSFMEILPDTFHMNIEETDMLAALKEYAPYYSSIHLSDNNRYFPGYGAIDFEKIFEQLISIGYEGGFAFEGNIKESFAHDSREAMSFINNIIKRMEI